MTVLFLAVLCFWQDNDCRSCDLLSHLASALSEGNEVRFMGYIDKSTPKYQDIESNVTALTAQSDVSASLDVINESGDGEKVDVVVDWFMQMSSKDGTEHVTRRRQRVNVTERKFRDKWKVTAINPIAILAPVTIQ